MFSGSLDKKTQAQNKRVKQIIAGLGLVVVVVVGYLLSPANTFKTASPDSNYSILSHVNAGINTLSTFILLIALLAIQRGRVKLHRYLMTTTLVLGVVFLINYIIYHLNVGHVIYGDLNHDGLLDTLEYASLNILARLTYFYHFDKAILSVLSSSFL